jgi:glycosyltransferase involved in cell wall biosynthesis
MEYKYFLSVCLCIKNEAKYIEEYINHYINQGVDHFYIINNNSDDNIEEFINNSDYKSIVTLITDNREINLYGTGMIVDLFKEHFYNLIKLETEWAIIVDIDEFMYGKNGYTIKSYLKSLEPDIGCIYVIWNIMNPYKDENNNLINDFSIKNNVKRINHDLMNTIDGDIKFANDFGKTIFKTALVPNPNCIWIHFVKAYGCKTINNYGIEKKPSIEWQDNNNKIDFSEENFSKANIALNHYAIRNLEDYNKKIKALHGDYPQVRKYFIHCLLKILNVEDSSLLTDDSIANIC